MKFQIPNVKMGLVAVSRDCFPVVLSDSRRENIAKLLPEVYNCKTVIENENQIKTVINELKNNGCNALVVFLGNFGPETPETLLCKYFDGPVMYVAASEDSKNSLIHGRGDAYCGMLNCSYNLGLRNLTAYIPEYPVGTAKELAEKIKEFYPIARALIGISSLKIISFGPRPQDFYACNAPIKPLYDLGVEVQENSELDLLVEYRKHANDDRIISIVKEMEQELGVGNTYPDLLPKMAQYELTLIDFAEKNKGVKDYVVFANKCWPAFPSEFGFEPCYVHSRLASRGMPVACEVDIYGALSEFIGVCVTASPVTILDINNTVPEDMYIEQIENKYPYKLSDVFMGFHCGNTPICKLNCGKLNFQLNQNQLLEKGGTPNITRGILEGDIAKSQITLFRIQATASGELRAYVAEGEVLPVSTCSFGGTGVIAINEMGRFYRHALIEKQFPHHGAVVFEKSGKIIYEIFKLLNIKDISYNRAKEDRYPTENPF